MMSPPPTAMIVAMEIRRSAPDCCLGERVLELTTDREHVFVYVRVAACICAHGSSLIAICNLHTESSR